MKKNKKTDKIEDISSKHSELTNTLFKTGLNCINYPIISLKILEQGYKTHGMYNKETIKLIEILNKKMKRGIEDG